MSSPLIEDKCLTVVGADPHVPCIFPFICRGIIHETCTLIDAKPGKAWCSTEVDDKGYAILRKGKWGICGSDCPIISSKPKIRPHGPKNNLRSGNNTDNCGL